jgi:hypothetical protein
MAIMATKTHHRQYPVTIYYLIVARDCQESFVYFRPRMAAFNDDVMNILAQHQDI